MILLPVKMSGRFQPLDVDFFNALKAAYHCQLDEYQLGSSLRGVAKGMFWGWHQRAWQETVTSHQIRGAWRKSGLFPLDPAIMGIEELAVRKADEEEARRKCRHTAQARCNETEPNAAHACTPGPSGTS